MKTILALLAIFLTACGTATEYTREPAAVDIDRFVTRVLQEIPEAPSLGIAVVKDGRVVYRRNPDTGYYIGSTTKAYTGLAMAILGQRGLVDLDAPITRYLPELTMAPPLDASKLTLRKFLTHTSAIRNDPIVFRTAYSGEHSQQLLVSLLGSASKPGKEGFRYDNLGYVVASIVIERVTGKPWQKALDELVFRPLRMTRTTAYMSEALRSPMVKPYQHDNQGALVLLEFNKTDQMMHAAGGLVTTPDDLAKWLNANVMKEGGGIPRAAFEQAQRLQAETVIDRGEFKSRGYGFGWYEGDFDGERALFHGGGYQGWQSWYSFMPDRKIGVGVMTNASGPAGRVLQLVTSYAYDRLLEKPVNYDEKLATLKADIAKVMTGFRADAEKRAQRPWSLKHPNAAYAGRYENPGYGVLVIREEGDKLVATLASLRGVVEAFTEPETARVEIVPGNGEVLRFTFENDRVTGVKWGDEMFRRVE